MTLKAGDRFRHIHAGTEGVILERFHAIRPTDVPWYRIRIDDGFECTAPGDVLEFVEPLPAWWAMGDSEGWGVFESDGSKSGPLQIQKVDFVDEDGVPQLDTEEQAWELFVRRLITSDEVALDLADVLNVDNPLELHSIINWLAGWPPPNPKNHPWPGMEDH